MIPAICVGYTDSLFIRHASWIIIISCSVYPRFSGSIQCYVIHLYNFYTFQSPRTVVWVEKYVYVIQYAYVIHYVYVIHFCIYIMQFQDRKIDEYFRKKNICNGTLWGLFYWDFLNSSQWQTAGLDFKVGILSDYNIEIAKKNWKIFITLNDHHYDC